MSTALTHFLKRTSFIIALISIVTIGSTVAFFSDIEKSVNNVFAVGGIDLQIDNDSWYNGVHQPQLSWDLKDLTGELFFNFTDLKPGDWEEDTISLHVNDNDSWVCAEIELTDSSDNGINEPEAGDGDITDGPWAGELDNQLEFIAWADDGDNVLEDDEALSLVTGTPSELPQDPGLPVAFPIADSQSNLFGTDGDPLPASSTHYIGKAFCFGEMLLNPLSQDESDILRNPGGAEGPGFTCNGSDVDNTSQTDSIIGNISFTAVQSRDLPDYICGQPIPSSLPSPTLTPSPVACVETYASSASHNNQGTRKDGGVILANRTVESAMFGSPQTSGASSDVGFPPGSFFSLGFDLTPEVPGEHGSIVLGFDSPFYPNPLGADLQVFEVTGGVYPDEKVKVEVGSSDTGPWTIVSASATRDEDLELPGIVLSAQYVRLTDVSDISLFTNDADAYDVDAVKALCGSE